MEPPGGGWGDLHRPENGACPQVADCSERCGCAWSHQAPSDCVGFDPTQNYVTFTILTRKRTLWMAGGPHSSLGLAGRDTKVWAGEVAGLPSPLPYPSVGGSSTLSPGPAHLGWAQRVS